MEPCIKVGDQLNKKNWRTSVGTRFQEIKMAFMDHLAERDLASKLIKTLNSFFIIHSNIRKSRGIFFFVSIRIRNNKKNSNGVSFIRDWERKTTLISYSLIEATSKIFFFITIWKKSLFVSVSRVLNTKHDTASCS